MKIGEWDNLGRARALLQRQLGDLGAQEYATHVTRNADTGRLRVFVATDTGLLDYQYSPVSSDPQSDWILRGQLIRWRSVRGLRLQTDAQVGDTSDAVRSIWRLVAEEPKMELSGNSETDDSAVGALLAFARACLQHAG